MHERDDRERRQRREQIAAQVIKHRRLARALFSAATPSSK